MNPTAISASIGLANNLWSRFKDYREEKELEAYAALEGAAARAESRSKDLFPEARRNAGAVTQAAHERLERTIAELKERGQEAGKQASERFEEARKDAKKAQRKTKKQAKKQSKAARKAANKAQKQSAKKLKKAKKVNFRKEDKGSKFWPFALILTLVSAVAGGAYYFFKIRKEAPSEVPPRVEDFGGGADAAAEGSTLVYTSTSEQDLKKDSDLAEEGVVERDEELLGSIDEQLAKHKEEAAAAEADTSRITDDREDEGKHRLQTDEQE